MNFFQKAKGEVQKKSKIQKAKTELLKLVFAFCLLQFVN